MAIKISFYKVILFKFFFLALSFNQLIFAADHTDNPVRAGMISREVYQEAFIKATNAYQELVESQGFTIEAKLANGAFCGTMTNRAYANRQEKRLLIYYPMVCNDDIQFLSKDQAYLVACHEMGHHLGGLPILYEFPSLSGEGAADYFATSKCMKNLLSDEDHIKFIKNEPIDPYVAKKCDQFHEKDQEKALCKRVSLAIEKFIFQTAYTVDKDYSGKQPKFGEQPKERTPLAEQYPRSQCRMNNLLAGALCPIDFNDPDICEQTGKSEAARQKCWAYGDNIVKDSKVFSIQP